MVEAIIKYYTAADGRVFDTRAEAVAHEEATLDRAALNLIQYKGSYAYGRLVREHNLSDYGLWEIRGEDSNCDLSGSHHMPSLGLFEGTLDEVIRKAVSLPGFFSWGGGGDVRPVARPEKLS